MDALDRIADLIDHSEYVPGVQLFDHIVYDFLQRFDFRGKIRIIGLESALGLIHYLVDGVKRYLQLGHGSIREFLAFGPQAFYNVRYVHSQVTDTLVADHDLDDAVLGACFGRSVDVG